MFKLCFGNKKTFCERNVRLFNEWPLTQKNYNTNVIGIIILTLFKLKKNLRTNKKVHFIKTKVNFFNVFEKLLRISKSI